MEDNYKAIYAVKELHDKIRLVDSDLLPFLCRLYILRDGRIIFHCQCVSLSSRSHEAYLLWRDS